MLIAVAGSPIRMPFSTLDTPVALSQTTYALCTEAAWSSPETEEETSAEAAIVRFCEEDDNDDLGAEDGSTGLRIKPSQGSLFSKVSRRLAQAFARPIHPLRC